MLIGGAYIRVISNGRYCVANKLFVYVACCGMWQYLDLWITIYLFIGHQQLLQYIMK